MPLKQRTSSPPTQLLPRHQRPHIDTTRHRAMSVLPRLVARRTYATTGPARLAKPTKFTPPSHPARQPLKDPVHYPGPPVASSGQPRSYPETLPPPDTLAYRVLTSRRLHFYLSLGILSLLAGTVTVSNFLRTNPHARDIEWSWRKPGASACELVAAWRRSVDDETERVKEKRRRAVEDVEKRGAYRKRHGLEETGKQGGFGGFGTKTREKDPRAVGLSVDKADRAKEDWVEEELRKVEREAVGAALPAVEEKKSKGGWW